MVRTRDGSRRLGYQTPKPPSRPGVPQHHPAKEDTWPTLPGGQAGSCGFERALSEAAYAGTLVPNLLLIEDFWLH
jgi:hypothetical protein